jgi:hypothetical protein
MTTAVANEKWILTVRELHLGHCKETFRAGAVIELDESNGRLIIDGRRFNDTRDLDVLKRHTENFPNDPWVIPYSPEAREEIIAATRPKQVSQQKALKPDQKLQVIQSDEDLNGPIDISDTKIGQRNAAAKEAARVQKRDDGKMEVIRGDETVEERLASLKGKTDISSIAERARLKASGSARMAVVKDDSLGAGFTGKNAVARNAGQYLPSREQADANKENSSALAEARKKEVEMRRKASGGAVGEDAVQTSGTTSEASEGAAEASGEASMLKDQNASLKAENEDLKARMDRLEKMIVAQQAPRRGPGRPPKAPAPAAEGA